MTDRPEFQELVGDEGTPEELERLRRVHEALVAAGPPAELSPRLGSPPRVEESRVLAFRRRSPATLIAIAAALVVAAFLVGYGVGENRNGFSSKASVPMHGLGRLAAASATLQIGGQDSAGNYPVRMTVRDLQPLPRGGWYELLLSKNGKPTLSCGHFRATAESVTIQLSVPYDLSERGTLFDGWVVTLHRPGTKAAPVVMTT